MMINKTLPFGEQKLGRNDLAGSILSSKAKDDAGLRKKDMLRAIGENVVGQGSRKDNL